MYDFRHLVIRARQRLNLAIGKTSMFQHISLCQCCKAIKPNANSFKIIGQCNTDREANAEEALLTQKYRT